MDVAFAEPLDQAAAGHALQPDPQELIRQEEDLAVGGNRVDHGFRVTAGAAVIALGLDLGGGVDVADDHGAGVLGLPCAKLVGVDRGGQRAAGVQVRDQHGLVGRQDDRGLGHEMHAAKHDHLGVGLGRLARESERVAHIVGDVLHLGHLVVVGQDDGPALAGEITYLVVHRRIQLRGHETSRETSSHLAEWVIAPTEMTSTPVRAISRIVSS